MLWIFRGVRNAAWTILLASALAGCGGGADDPPPREPGDRLRGLLGQAPDTGTMFPLVAGDTINVSTQTIAFYRRLRFQPAWLEGLEPAARADSILSTIARATDDGLDPNEYGHAIAQRIIATLEHENEDGEPGLDDDARADYLADLDLVLSEGFMRYASDVVQGTIPPEDGPTWQIRRRDAPTWGVLRSVARGGDPQQVIQRLRPASPNYQRLMSALRRMRDIRDSGGWPALPGGLGLTEGDSAPAVAQLRLRLLRSDDVREATLARRGETNPTLFDRDLRDALRHFQARHALDDDGRLGTGTLRELNHTVDERIAELELNLDRWRWLPARLGELFIVVNIAGFELEVVEHDRTIEAMNVVVGKPGWNTPVFSDTVENIVINPYWTPPPSIVEEEILPAVARDPSYLTRNGFERTRDGGFRQRPGPRNALGKYKFLFPNQHDVYLHDTPADHLFSQARRDFSHGCIRVERPADLARLLVSKATSTVSPAAIDAMVDTRAEKWIPLKRKIPIYIVYFTTWVKEDGTLHFHHDVYGHDEELERAMGQRVAAVSAGG